MTGYCLSLAPILRCESLTRIESEVLIIPTALELLFSFSLVIINWGKGRRSFLLAAEGWVYFSLALIDLLAHIFPATRNSFNVFRILDIVVGAASFLPILFYVLFLFFSLRSDFFPSLPRRFQRIAQYTLMLFIPALIVADLVGSFIGVSYTFLPNPANPAERLLAVGFASDRDQTLWNFFSSFALALLTAYQALAFCVVFFRLVKSFVDQRSIETSGQGDHQVVLFKGLGWLAIGLKLGAVETIVGFARDGFGVPLVRRILRFLSRACIIIGVVKGMDIREDFTVFDTTRPQSEGRRKSALRMLISNPRQSTFRRMSAPLDPQLAAALANLGIERPNEKSQNPHTSFHQQQQQLPFPQAAYTGAPSPSPVLTYKPRPTSRVTVLMTPGTAPTLNLRFSGLDMPSPTEIAHIVEEEVKSRPDTQVFVRSHRSRSRSQGTSHLLLHRGDTFDTRSSFFETTSLGPMDTMMPDIPVIARPPPIRTRSWRYSDRMDDNYTPSDSGISGHSMTADALRGLGPRRSLTLEQASSENTTRTSSLSAGFFYEHDNEHILPENEHGGDLERGPSQRTYKQPKLSSSSERFDSGDDYPAYPTPKADRFMSTDRRPFMVPDGRYSLSSLSLSPSTIGHSTRGGASPEPRPTLSSLIAQRSQTSSPWVSRPIPSSYRPVTRQEIDMYDGASSRASSSLDFSRPSGDGRPSTDTAETSQVLHVQRRLINHDERSPRPDLVRIKSVGRVPRRETPTPSASPYVGHAAPVGFEDLEVIPSWEAYSSSTPSTESPSSANMTGKPVMRHDSNVLSQEDQEHIRNSMYDRDEEGIYWVGNEAQAV
ncbi:hypothetical protein GLOTRDRAFT_132572 [Gloeophyllum trabeum ATCC 11539]|uniref:Uncharacterized protein n=1 Tax=Gloeophyllum trabeum (strain ATCC 11539 / FP-39264 / Madison 617) TaxID=670483 RepID=S7RGR1_GLOTA|nr:uncharacterized protein GLOTRDRAFT_132572 [Gloeophyllum trabeum ATCC 11539]EPQ51754.1 hypothetical protein GLOTRDRAFT_132572 [Gloeophyllum trabeum ATCC 11539]